MLVVKWNNSFSTKVVLIKQSVDDHWWLLPPGWETNVDG